MSRNYDTTQIPIEFAWNPNAIKGYLISLAVFVLCWLIGGIVKPTPPEPFRIRESNPITILSFGDGDGTGGNSGNLSEKGAARKGETPTNPLTDASRAATSANGKNTVSDPSLSNQLKPVADAGRKGADNITEAERNIGSSTGADNGTGLSMAGTGSGAGKGFGNIDWGGGGNRTVLTKISPVKPPGSLNTTVLVRFRVASDGSVGRAWVVRRSGDPAVDAAAVNAIKRWRFNPIAEGEMEGTIPFVFENR